LFFYFSIGRRSSCFSRGESEDGDDEGSSDSNNQQDGFDQATRQALSEIDECQKELDVLNDKEANEIRQVVTKHNKLWKSYYDMRATLIEKIPNFWTKAFLKNPHFPMFLSQGETDCLQFMKKLEVEESENENENGLRIKLIFDENPFFENRELIKEFHLGANCELIKE